MTLHCWRTSLEFMLNNTDENTPRLASPEEITHALKVSTASAVGGFLLFVLACSITYWFFEARAARYQFDIWVVGSVIVLSIWFLLNVALLFRKPTTRELIRIWAPASKFVLLGADAIVVASIWLLLPFADQTTMLCMMTLYTMLIPTQVLCSPENTEIIRIGIVSVLGSLVAWLLLKGGAIETAFAVFFFSSGVLFFFVSDIIRRSVRSAVTARLLSDSIALKLEKAYAEVALQRDAKTHFIAAASHDLGQPLQAANLFFDQAMRASDEATRNKAAQGVRRSFEAADQLLSHMLNHLRLEADAVEPQLSLVNIAENLQRLRLQSLPLASQKDIEIRVAPCNAQVLVDPTLLDRALGNLLNNAIVHSGASKVLIGCLHVKGSRLRVYVIDNGVGIGSADAKHVFNDFYRGSDSVAKVKMGFGLGLASVKRIALLMEGVAALDERWMNGAAFYLEFPRRNRRSKENGDKVRLNERRKSHADVPNL
jgi:two-component system, sensor histidine kinase